MATFKRTELETLEDLEGQLRFLARSDGEVYLCLQQNRPIPAMVFGTEDPFPLPAHVPFALVQKLLFMLQEELAGRSKG
jgi:hypothetical protein